ncbi:ISNCY family transposase [Acetobacterium carbinolicum]|jgi:Integrase core domain.|uniref:ISNCY family transposase n=1 Tax=Acetobacterium carbinolicum TaxID=52690 RepID=UPI0039C9C4CB
MNEELKYQTIKLLVDTHGNKKTAALRIGCSSRHINRLINGYRKTGKSFFVHGNQGRQPAHTVDSETKQLIIDLYRTRYYGTNFQHFQELLGEHEAIQVSISVVRSALASAFILSPKACRITKKNLKKQLEAMQQATTSKKQSAVITASILAIEDAHPRRPRCAFFGEMLQMDASLHHWFGDEKSQLHIAVDDATNTIVGAYFDRQETLDGYYHILHQILNNHGIPYLFFTDRRTVFEYKQKKSPSLEGDTFTQFGYACKQLGIDIKTSSVPQAKGRVERMFQTLQSRLPFELQLAGATTLELANKFLNSYIKKFNAQFALAIDHTKSVFELQPNPEKINLTLAVLSNRKVDNGHCIRFNNRYFRLLDAKGLPVYHYKGTSGMVIQAFDQSLFFCVGKVVYALDEIPKHELTSKNFDFIQPVKKPRKRYIPPMSHPWKQASFERYVNKQAHRFDLPDLNF